MQNDGKPVTAKRECDHKLAMPIKTTWFTRSYRIEAMTRLRAFSALIAEWEKTSRHTQFCCFYETHQADFYNLCDCFRLDYTHQALTEDTVRSAYSKTLNRLKNSTGLPNQPKNERGCQDWERIKQYKTILRETAQQC